MPDKNQIYVKYAMRLLEDLQQLHGILSQLLFHIPSSTDFSHLLESQQRLAHRIDIQKNFLDLIKQQHPSQIPLNHSLENEISALSQIISQIIDKIQIVLAQKREELRQVLRTSQYYFRGHKKALCQNHSTPRMLDIIL